MTLKSSANMSPRNTPPRANQATPQGTEGSVIKSKLLLSSLIATTMLHGQVLGGSKVNEYVDGYGWANPKQVTACLISVGAQDTDELSDAQWDEWVACMTLGTGKRRR